MPNLIGKTLGRYHILEQLGEGGMATVFKAYDTRLERDVAVKVLRTDQFAPAVLEHIQKRFERETKALAKLSHSNIVKVHDFGSHEGAPYLVMEYLPGGTLKQKLGKPIPWQEAVHLLLPIAEALEYAHEQNVIHRDVKPANILLTKKGQPMLTDFGIAKILDMEDGQTLTATGMSIGTPEYMSPEQGMGEPVDGTTDIYSLGVVLYELLTGRKPYQADTPMAVLLMHASEPLPRPTRFVPDLPEGVERLLIKALAKKVEERFADMGTFVKALENLQIEALATTGEKGKEMTATVPEEIPGVRTAIETVDLQAPPPQATPRRESAPEVKKAGGEPIRPSLPAATRQARPKAKSGWKTWVFVGGGIFLVITAICAILGIGGAINAYNTNQANEAATATKLTEIRNATATAQARIDFYDSWQLVVSDGFNDNSNDWLTGDINGELYSGTKTIADGRMTWDVGLSTGFVARDKPSDLANMADLYVSVEGQRNSGVISSACYGVYLRAEGSNYYAFRICDDNRYKVSLHTDEGGWEDLVSWSYTEAIRAYQVNKVAVAARGSHLEFFVNDQLIDSVDDDRRVSGQAGVMIAVSNGETASFSFDNLVLRVP